MRARLSLSDQWSCYAGLIGVPCNLTFLFTSLAPGAFLSSVFFTSGVAPGFPGVPVGDETGEATGLAVATGAGVAGGLFGGVAAELQAPNTAVEAARTVPNTTDLLIFFLLNISYTRTRGRPLADIAAGRNLNGSFTVCHQKIAAHHRSYSTPRVDERQSRRFLQTIFRWVSGRWSIARRRLARAYRVLRRRLC